MSIDDDFPLGKIAGRVTRRGIGIGIGSMMLANAGPAAAALKKFSLVSTNSTSNTESPKGTTIPPAASITASATPGSPLTGTGIIITLSGGQVYTNNTVIGTTSGATKIFYTNNHSAYWCNGTTWAGPITANNAGSAIAWDPTLYPVLISSNGHYLTTQGGKPWLWFCSQVHAMIQISSVAQATADMQARLAQGFNCGQLSIILNATASPNGSLNSYTGVDPFSNTQDLTQPYEPYFQYVDQMFTAALNLGYNLVVTVVDNYVWINNTWIQSQPLTSWQSFGNFIGNRYRKYPNIIWMFGDDYNNPWSADSAYVPLHQAILAVDNTHLTTGELEPPALTLDNLNWTNVAKGTMLNWVYGYESIYFQIARGYSASPAVPVFLGETSYEIDSGCGCTATGTVTQLALRAATYWTFTCGGCGLFWGAAQDTDMNGAPSTGSGFQTIAINFLKQLNWWLLVPDISIPCTYGVLSGVGGMSPSSPVITGHTFVTAGYGTLETPNVGYNSGPDWDAAPLNYVSSAVSSDKTFAVAYCPASTTITCNMGAFNAKVNAYWFDPTAGSFPGTLVSGSPFNNSGSRRFTTPGNNSAGDPDWILYFTTNIPRQPRRLPARTGSGKNKLRAVAG